MMARQRPINWEVFVTSQRVRPLVRWLFIQNDVLELSEEFRELFRTLAMEDAEDPGDHLKLDGFQFAFFKLFRRLEPI